MPARKAILDRASVLTQEQCFRRNKPFVTIVAIHVVQNRHAGELEQDKQGKLPFTKIMYAFYLSCLSATFALQHGRFVPREWLTAKGPFMQRNEAGMCRSLSISNRSCATLCAKVKK